MSISQAELARRVGYSRQYIHKLIKQGKLSTDSKGRVDENKVFSELKALAEPGRGNVKKKNTERKKANASKDNKKSQTKGSEQSQESPAGGLDPEEADTEQVHRIFNQARAKKESFASLIRELDYYIRKGDYVSVSEVKQDAEQVVGALIAALDSVPARLAPKLMQRDSLPEIQRILEDGINEAKRAMQEELNKVDSVQEKSQK